MLNYELFNNAFKVDEANNTRKNSFNDTISILPYNTNKNFIEDFYIVLGGLLREADNTKSVNAVIDLDLISESMIKDLVSETSLSTEKIKDILIDLYFENGKLKRNSSNLLKYASSDKVAKAISMYLFDVLISENSDTIKSISEKEMISVLDEFFYKLLPELEKTDERESKYFVVAPAISKVFTEDLQFFINSNNFSIDILVKLIEFYYFIYTSQTMLKLNQQFIANRNSIEPLYFAVDWESISSSRKCVEYGYRRLLEAYDKIFMNVIILQIINCDDDRIKKDYIDFKVYFDALSDDVKAIYQGELYKIYLEYRNKIKPNGKQFNGFLVSEESDIYDIVIEFYEYIRYQVANSARKAPAGRYVKDFREFVESNFVKVRGRLGRSLNITDDYIIMLTKLIIKDNERLRLIDVFDGFEKRGVSLDDATRDVIAAFYDRINILEKKSDSGAVQYVKKF